MAIIRKIPWTEQPQEAVGVDWGNPLSHRLVAAIVAGNPIELVSGVPATNYPELGVGLNGRHLSQSALNSTQMTLGKSVDIAAGSDITGFCVLNSSTFATAGNNSGFWRSGNSGTTFIFLQGLTGYPWIRVNGSDVLKPTSGTVIDVTKPNSRLFWRIKSGAWVDYGFDGKSVNFASTAQAVPASTITTIGSQFGPNNSIGNAPLLLFFARALSDSEVGALTDNPWQLFVPRVQRIFTAAAAATFKPAWARGSNQVLGAGVY